MRVAPRPLAQLSWYLKPLFWLQRRRYGEVLEPALIWARSPALFLPLSLFVGAVDRKSSPIDPALRALVMVRVSQLNHCAFCVDINAATLMKCGAPEEKVLALHDWRRSNLFDERERTVLDYAEAMTSSERRVDDALMAKVRRHFDENATVELTALIAFQNLSSKFNSALDVPSQGFCAIPAPGMVPQSPPAPGS